MKRLLSLLLASMLFVDTAGHTAEPARIELYAVPTMTLTDQQSLTGVREGQPTTIGEELRLPTEGNARVPAVILLHGSGGVTAWSDRWARELNDMGIATFILDRFTGRGIVSTVGNQGRLSVLTEIYDVYRAFELLAKHPRIDSKRIALFGSSRGAVVALYASLKRFQKMQAAPNTEFAAYISFYPPCSTTYVDDTEVAAQPIRLFHGTADDIASIEMCRSYVERLKNAGRDVEPTEYVGAHHGLDNPALPPTQIATEGPIGVKPCSLYEDAKGRILNRATDQPHTQADPCNKRRGTLGHDPIATAKSTEAVKALLRSALKL